MAGLVLREDRNGLELPTKPNFQSIRSSFRVSYLLLKFAQVRHAR
jgi:hypothetical protein